MKVLQINVTINRSSHGKIAEQIGLLAMEQGWDSYVAYGRHNVTSRSSLIKIGGKWSQFLHLVSSRLFDNHGLCSYFATKQLLRKIDKINPDVVHLHNIHGYYLNYKLLFNYLAKFNKPVLWTLHDCWAYTGHCAHFISINCEKWKSQCYDCPLKRDYPTSMFLDQSKRNFKLKKKLFTSIDDMTIVTVSEWLGKMTRQSFLGKYPVKVIHSGIDLDIFQPREETKTFSSTSKIATFVNDKHIILAVAAKWSEDKGLSDYYKLSKIIADEYVIVLVGELNESKFKLPENIIHINKTQDQIELSYMYSMASVVLSMSIAETMGLTLVEAMACGTPVIAYNNTAQPEQVTPEVGYIVENGDVKTVYDKILEICKVGKDHYSRACRERAIHYYCNRDCFQDYIDVYKELTQR